MRLQQGARSVFLREFLAAFALSLRCMFKPKPKLTLNYPKREKPSVAALSRRACVAALSQRRRALHRL